MKYIATTFVLAILGWGGTTLIAHTGDIASAKTNFEYIKEDLNEIPGIKKDISEIKSDIRSIKESLEIT